ncbi:uncharacterized protein BKA78DRAFT_355755 [Phyllosticta capitalensis]|uniref:uncharacterized protein n=1 Tax=Phyllosticta capitalensis TaxID=121624 RepID=UPI003130BFC9
MPPANDQWKLSAKKVLQEHAADMQQPAILAHYLVDACGQPPQQEYAAWILNKMEEYANAGDAKTVKFIDTAIKADGAQGINWGQQQGYLPDGDHRDKALDFIRNARRHILPGTGRMTRPWGAFECAVDCQTRIEEHRKHQKGAYLMYLAEAICARYLRQYSIKHFIICKLWAVEQAWAGEVLMTRIGNGYTTSGWGLNSLPASFSAEDADEVPMGKWCDYAEHALLHSPLRANYERQTQIAIERAKKAAEQESRRIEAEIADKERELELRKQNQHPEQIRSRERLEEILRRRARGD